MCVEPVKPSCISPLCIGCACGFFVGVLFPTLLCRRNERANSENLVEPSRENKGKRGLRKERCMLRLSLSAVQTCLFPWSRQFPLFWLRLEMAAGCASYHVRSTKLDVGWATPSASSTTPVTSCPRRTLSRFSTEVPSAL